MLRVFDMANVNVLDGQDDQNLLNRRLVLILM